MVIVNVAKYTPSPMNGRFQILVAYDVFQKWDKFH